MLALVCQIRYVDVDLDVLQVTLSYPNRHQREAGDLISYRVDLRSPMPSRQPLQRVSTRVLPATTTFHDSQKVFRMSRNVQKFAMGPSP
jgi:hypothetical protein